MFFGKTRITQCEYRHERILVRFMTYREIRPENSEIGRDGMGIDSLKYI